MNMGLEEQLKFEFLNALEAKDEQQSKVLGRKNELQKRIEHYKNVVITSALAGWGIVVVGLTSREGFADDPYVIALAAIGAPYGMMASQYALDKLSDFNVLIKEKLSNFYQSIQRKNMLTIYKA